MNNPLYSLFTQSYYFLDFVEGGFFKDAALPQVASKEARFDMYCSLINTLAKIHAIDIDKVGLETYGKRMTNAVAVEVNEKGYIARQVKVKHLKINSYLLEF